MDHDEPAKRARKILRIIRSRRKPSAASLESTTHYRARELAEGPTYWDIDESTTGGRRYPDRRALPTGTEVSRSAPTAGRISQAPLRLSAHRVEQLLQQRVVVLSGPIDDAIADQLVGQFLRLETEDPAADITFYLNSRGGYVTAAYSVFDTMNMVKPAVSTCALGVAAGMAQFLLSAGALGKRYAFPHARVALLPMTFDQSSSSALRDLPDMWFNEIARVTARNTGQPLARVRADLIRKRWFTPVDAQRYGMIDHVGSPPQSQS